MEGGSEYLLSNHFYISPGFRKDNLQRILTVQGKNLQKQEVSSQIKIYLMFIIHWLNNTFSYYLVITMFVHWHIFFILNAEKTTVFFNLINGLLLVFSTIESIVVTIYYYDFCYCILLWCLLLFPSL